MRCWLTGHNAFVNAFCSIRRPRFYTYFVADFLRILEVLAHATNTQISIKNRVIIVGFVGSILGLLINSLFHNSGMFVGGYFEFYLWGVVAALLSSGSLAYSQR